MALKTPLLRITPNIQLHVTQDNVSRIQVRLVNKCACKHFKDLQNSENKLSIRKSEFLRFRRVSAERARIWARNSKFSTEFCRNGGKFQRLKLNATRNEKSKVTNCQSRTVELPNTPNAGDNLHLKRTQSLTHTACN